MKRVLMIDDEAGVSQLVQALLRDEGFEVRAESNGPAGLAALDEMPFDVVLLDLMMPGMSGWEFLDALQTRADGRPPVAILSAVFGDDEIRRALDVYGANAYITKPFRIAELLETVVRLTGTPNRPA